LWDYSDDERLLFRLNQVLDRVGLETLPEKFMDVLGPARRTIAAEVGRLAPGYIEESI
jgi:hypothetical protein